MKPWFLHSKIIFSSSTISNILLVLQSSFKDKQQNTIADQSNTPVK